MLIFPNHVQKSFELIKTSFRLWYVTLGSVWHFSFLSGLATIAYNSIVFEAKSKGNLWIPTMLYVFCSSLAHTVIIDCIHYTVRVDYPYNPPLSIAFKKSFIFMMAVFMVSFALIIGTVLFVVPGIILSVSLFFAPYLVVIHYKYQEDKSFQAWVVNSVRRTVESIKESLALVNHQWWFTSLRLSIILCPLVLILGFCMCIILGFSYWSPTVYSVAQLRSFFEFIISTFFYPLVHASVLTVLYDLQIRKKEQS